MKYRCYICIDYDYIIKYNNHNAQPVIRVDVHPCRQSLESVGIYLWLLFSPKFNVEQHRSVPRDPELVCF